MGARTGKIARIPRPLREELNRRLQNGVPGRSIVTWLNNRTEVQEMLAAQFEGREINEQNLTEWKQGGYSEWLAKQELVERVRDVAGDAAELTEAGGAVADHAARLLSVRFALALAEWDGEPDHPAAAKLRALSTISRELIALRRGDHSAARLHMEQHRFDTTCKDGEEADRLEIKETLGKQFENWLQRPDVQKLVMTEKTALDDRLNAIRRIMWGSAAGLGMSTEEKQKTKACVGVDGDGI